MGLKMGNAKLPIRTAFSLLIILMVITGIIYPLVVTALAQLMFNWQANGSLVTLQDKVVGSLFIGQSFTDPAYFWGRPSATTPYPYNAASSSGSNLGPSNPAYLKMVADRVAIVRQNDSIERQLIPVDLVTASASGLDPEISPYAAYHQANRIAKLRGVSEAQILNLINSFIINRDLGLFGEPRVNVLQLNIALDQSFAKKKVK